MTKMPVDDMTHKHTHKPEITEETQYSWAHFISFLFYLCQFQSFNFPIFFGNNLSIITLLICRHRILFDMHAIYIYVWFWAWWQVTTGNTFFLCMYVCMFVEEFIWWFLFWFLSWHMNRERETRENLKINSTRCNSWRAIEIWSLEN